MPRNLTVAIVGLVMAVGVVACGSGEGSASYAGAVDERMAIDASIPGKPGHQYRAVCEELSAHNGRPYVLSRWLDSREKAVEYGNYHGSHKAKWHRWTLQEREKPGVVAQ